MVAEPDFGWVLLLWRNLRGVQLAVAPRLSSLSISHPPTLTLCFYPAPYPSSQRRNGFIRDVVACIVLRLS